MANRGLWLDAKTYVFFKFWASQLEYELFAFVDNVTVAELVWDGPESYNPGEILWVGTEPGYRRKGIASELFRRARKLTNLGLCIEPIHSQSRTHQGREWSKKVGGLVFTDDNNVTTITQETLDRKAANRYRNRQREKIIFERI